MSAVFFIFAVGVDGGLCRERLFTRAGSVIGCSAERQQESPSGLDVLALLCLSHHTPERLVSRVALMRESQKRPSVRPRIARLWILVLAFEVFTACAWLGGAKRRRLVSRQAHATVPNGFNHSFMPAKLFADQILNLLV